MMYTDLIFHRSIPTTYLFVFFIWLTNVEYFLFNFETLAWIAKPFRKLQVLLLVNAVIFGYDLLYDRDVIFIESLKFQHFVILDLWI